MPAKVLVFGSVLEHAAVCDRVGLDTRNAVVVHAHSYQQTIGVLKEVAFLVTSIQNANMLAAVERLRQRDHLEITDPGQLEKFLALPPSWWET